MSKELKAFFWAMPAGVIMAGGMFLVPESWFLPVAALPMMPEMIADNITILTAMLSYLTAILGFVGIFCARIFAVQGDEMARFCADHPVYRDSAKEDEGGSETPVIVYADAPMRRPVMVSAEFAAMAMGAANDAGGGHDNDMAMGQEEIALTVEHDMVEEDDPSAPPEESPDPEAAGDMAMRGPELPPEELDMLIAQMEASAEQRRAQLAALEMVAAKIASKKDDDGECHDPDAMSYRPLSAVPQGEAVSPDEDMDMALDSALEILQKINRRA